MSTSSYNISKEDVYIFPASFFQESLWFLDQLEPIEPSITCPLPFDLQACLTWTYLTGPKCNRAAP